MQDYEKLGAFYLGRDYDLSSQKPRKSLVLYDSKDLTTHAMILGMTGSGKTGLGLALIEEALIDRIPVIAIDPKGDLGNLLLTFPELRAEDFRPWVDEQEAVKQGLTLDTFAEQQAQLWRKGLEKWDQGPDRIARLRAAVDFSIYTPGSNAGRQVSILRRFDPAPSSLSADSDLLRERIMTTTNSLLALLGIDAEPLTSPEHILIANIFEAFWSKGEGLDLAGLIRAIQEPPFERLGVMDLDSFFPARDRFGLAMRLNNLLASPGFESWLAGDPLDIGGLLFGHTGKPRASIFSIAHLTDPERMFFVATLLNEILGWVRTQSGTSSLRAILYMDEIFGYFPPVKNPPSKAPLLTLLKQARAFGLGVVLSTQNPVDLDYKGLSNTGTWFIGRLQTEQDKQRVLGGLEGVTGGSGLNRKQASEILSQLGPRVFLLHNVHENVPAVFQSRWALSYLRGPLSRAQIKRLATAAAVGPEPDSDPAAGPSASESAAAGAAISQASQSGTQPPVLAPDIQTFHVRASGAGHGLCYYPAVCGLLSVHYRSVRHQVGLTQAMAVAVQLEDDTTALDWDDGFALIPDELVGDAVPGASYGGLPPVAEKSDSYRKWERDLVRWVRLNRPLILLRSKRFQLNSRPGESEAEFRSRIMLAAREQRDLMVEKLRRKYESRFATLNNQLLRAEQAVSREREEASSRTVSTAISFGTAILGAFLGRKAVTATSASRMGTAMRSAGRIRKEKMDVARAAERVDATRQQIDDLDLRLQDDIRKLEDSFDPSMEELDQVNVQAKSSDLQLKRFGLAWLPFRTETDGRLRPDWQTPRSE